MFDLSPPASSCSLCVLSDILQINRKRFICQLAVRGGNALVKLTTCQQSAHHTPTGMAEHLGVQVLTWYLVQETTRTLTSQPQTAAEDVTRHRQIPSQPPAGRAERCLRTSHSRWWFPAPGLLCSDWTLEIQCSDWIETERQRGPSLDTVLKREGDRK